ncbi:DNA polymerase III, subunit gamma/tau [Thermus oshimai JL-2]|uniref:DNA polymerase III subunit gamma/tau n=1 Tax=Thermus oshimai JL-2 TaxID=751945 RepID=K7RET7_THEOS|nr:DNA polymerase III subunit gamma/tau [Thermus oshimai]AFV75102.1 DNA polymerase III, subunit gamma/tau [Thermus oshimai JL-2]
MSALYRSFRPLTFEEVVGQEHVKEPLKRAIREGRLAQAYLFSGPRGVGKTTTARLLAMAVGCTGEGERPCGVCSHCRAVAQGSHPDVLEMDAASNNSVEDVRELRERIHLAPLSAPRKVFILDEAHMLSKSAFNALLKTLEEPPPHVLFVFATTEPERMPPTILSRTQHFRFRRLKEEEIAAKLRRILKEVGREAEEEALRLVARLADGAMRDAESLLDRLLLLEEITLARVEEALGLPPKEGLEGLAEALFQGDTGRALALARALYAQGFAPRSLVGGLLEVLRGHLYAKVEGGKGPSEVALIAAMKALDEGLERLSRRSDALGLEVVLLEAGLPFRTEGTPAPPPSKAEARPLEPPKDPAPPAQEAPPVRAFLDALKPTLRAFVREAEIALEGDTLYLRFPEAKAFHHQKALEHRAALLPVAAQVFGVRALEIQKGEGAEKKSPLTAPESTKKASPPRGLREELPPSQSPPPPPREEAKDPLPEAPEDPETLLRHLARRLGGRLLWVRKPRAEEAEEPLSEDEIGGNGI